MEGEDLVDAMAAAPVQLPALTPTQFLLRRQQKLAEFKETIGILASSIVENPEENVITYSCTLSTPPQRGGGDILSWLRHWVGDPGDKGKNLGYCRSILLFCNPFPHCVLSYSVIKGQLLIPCLYGVGRLH